MDGERGGQHGSRERTGSCTLAVMEGLAGDRHTHDGCFDPITRCPKILIAPLIYRVEGNKLYQLAIPNVTCEMGQSQKVMKGRAYALLPLPGLDGRRDRSQSWGRIESGLAECDSLCQLRLHGRPIDLCESGPSVERLSGIPSAQVS